jgi:hypothetical protein
MPRCGWVGCGGMEPPGATVPGISDPSIRQFVPLRNGGPSILGRIG